MRTLSISAALIAASFSSQLFAALPTLVSITPQSQITANPPTTTYTFVVADSDGAADLRGVDAVFGSNYECWLFYDHATNQISVFYNDDPASAGTWTYGRAGAGVTLFGNACAIRLAGVTVSTSGNNLSLSIPVTLGGTDGTHPIYMSAVDNAGRSTPYQQLASWTVQSSPASYSISVSPLNWYTTPGGSVSAKVTVTDNPGFTGSVTLSLGKFPDGSNLSGSFNPSSVVGNGTSTMTLNSTAATPVGYDDIQILALSAGGNIQQFGRLFVDNAPPALSMNAPSPGAGTAQTFAVRASDKATAAEIAGINVLINSTLDGQHACWMWYDAQTNYLWLANDDASSWTGIVFDGPAPVQNSQCSAGGPGATQQNFGISGPDLILRIPITFKPAFAGPKLIYERSSNFSGFESGYQRVGAYTVQ